MKISKEEKKNLYQKAKEKRTKDDSTQETLPYKEISPDGMSMSTEGSRESWIFNTLKHMKRSTTKNKS